MDGGPHVNGPVFVARVVVVVGRGWQAGNRPIVQRVDSQRSDPRRVLIKQYRHDSLAVLLDDPLAASRVILVPKCKHFGSNRAHILEL